MRGEPFDSQRLIRLREQLGLTQQGLAEVLKVSVQSIHRWESGKSRPLGVVVEKIEEPERRAAGHARRGNGKAG